MSQQTGAASAAAALSPKAKVQVRLTANVNVDTIAAIVKSIGGRYGCTTCGLAGIDLRLTGDPVEAAEFTKLAGVQAISFE